LNPYCATFIFSIKTDVAINLINQINNKFEYFTSKPKGWQLERVFLQCLKNITNNIHISKYIANNQELNTQAVWNRDGMNRNGAIFQVYPALDFDNQLYLHLISGFSDINATDDYLIEIRYLHFSKFLTLQKSHMVLEHLGDYKKGANIEVFHKGVKVYDEFLGLDAKDFIHVNKATFKNKNYDQVPPEKVNMNFIDGSTVEIFDNFPYERKFYIDFVDNKTNETIYNSIIKNGWWTKVSKKYFVDWSIKIKSDKFNHEYRMDLKDKKVLISFESKSLGDNLAWIPYVEEFREKHNCEVVCSTFFNELF
jgi:hypothetical protein